MGVDCIHNAGNVIYPVVPLTTRHTLNELQKTVKNRPIVSLDKSIGLQKRNMTFLINY